MSKLKITRNGINITTPKKLAKVWKKIEDGDCGPSELIYLTDIDDKILNMIYFLAVSNEMLAAYLDDWRYIFGDVDCLDMEEYTNSIIVRLNI